LTLLEPISPDNDETGTERPRSNAHGEHYVALLLAAFSVLSAIYSACIAASFLPFNSGAWVVGEDVALRGWLAYAISALVHLAAAAGLWKGIRASRWLAVFLLAVGLLPAVPGISAAVVDLRISGIALWGTLIVLRTAAIYMLMSAD
jgi:hypothetical protein